MARRRVALGTLAASAVLAFALPTLQANAAPVPYPNPTGTEATVRFQQRVAFDALTESLSNARGNAELVFVETLPNGEQLTTGVIIEAGEDPRAAALVALQESHFGLTSRAADETLAAKTVDRLTTTDSSLTQAASRLSSALTLRNGGPATAAGTAGSLEFLNVAPQSGDLAVCGASFQPSSTGYATYYFDDTRQRRLDVTFKWSAAYLANLKACGSNITYEHEVREYNYNGTHYFGTSTISWSSTMPNAYLDTPLSDSSNEISHTIGTSDARALSAGTDYRNTVVTGMGNSSTGKGKIQGQRGHRSPSTCTSTYCIFADQTLVVVPSWTMAFPKPNPV